MLTGDAAKEYLATKRCTAEKSMNQVLVDGLVALCKAKPIGTEAIRFLESGLLKITSARPGAKAPVKGTADTPPAPAATATAMVVPTDSQYPNKGVAIPIPEDTAKYCIYDGWSRCR